MQHVAEIAERIRVIGFQCRRCGDCCRTLENCPHHVFVGAREVRHVLSGTPHRWDDVVEPYPEFIEANGGAYTLGWCLRHTADRCIFLSIDGCNIYPNRPWICRTYPFMLHGDELIVSECKGIGAPMTMEEAERIARDLLARQIAEELDDEAIRDQLEKSRVPAGTRAVIDSEGVKVLHG
jgi:Fe-S-cluster containining protein